MASHATTAPVRPPSQKKTLAPPLLSFMTKLRPNVLLLKPAPGENTTSSSGSKRRNTTTAAPKMIFLGGWMGARDAHLAKYIARYRILYPSAQVLLVKSDLGGFISAGRAARDMAAAAAAIRAACLLPSNDSNNDETRPELLVHVLSNGGISTLAALYRTYQREARGPSLPRHVTIIDSAPGRFTWVGAWRALTAGLGPWLKLLFAPAISALLAWTALLSVLAPPDMLTANAAALNDRSDPDAGGGPSSSEVRRAYIYSREDRLVEWTAVEAHAADAERKGFAVRAERFEGSSHVAHVRFDEERYWRIVRETWEG